MLARFGGVEMVCDGRGWGLPGHVVYHDYCVSKGAMSSKGAGGFRCCVIDKGS